MKQSLLLRFLDLLRCPGCGGNLNVQTFTPNELDVIEGVLTCDCGHWYPIENGIPRLFIPGPLRPSDAEFITKWGSKLSDNIRSLDIKAQSSSDVQVQKTFGHKWTKQHWWGIEGKTAQFMEEWLLPRYGWKNKVNYEKYFSEEKVCLDAGCGLGREALRMASANSRSLVIGLELSECVDEAARHAREKKANNVFFIQADLTRPPLKQGSVDFIISEGVLHHTPDTKVAFMALVPLLAKNGEFGFYVYRKKAPLREYADDYIREQIAHLEPEDAWRSLESLTKLGKNLSELKVSVSIEEDIPLLDIKAGNYDIQRLIYYTMFKCFWNADFTFDENVHINYDWYTPRFAWRHTENEIRDWLKENGLLLAHENIEDAGITVRAKKV
ncbi:MAG: methyltransferase domain-containing protein [Nitrospirota bacterium]|nr:methyltransferase domain-containing protein [Nitrospirota bacterium]